MKTILIGGYYGANNLGDDAILESILLSLRKRQSDLRIIVASFNPQLTQERFSVESINWRQITGLARSVQEADLVIVGGGGLFQDYWGIDINSYYRNIHGGITTYGSLIKFAELFGKPCMLYAVGIGPLYSTEARQQTLELLKVCDAITLRDDKSLDLLQEIGMDFDKLSLRIQADPVFVLQSDEKDLAKASDLLLTIPRNDKAPVVGVSVRYWDKEVSQDIWTEILAQQLDTLVERTGAHLLFTPFQRDAESHYTDDASVSRNIYSKLRAKGNATLLDGILSPGVMQALFARCDLIIGMRLHSIIMALNAETPALAIAYDPKIRALMQPIGLGTFIVPMNEIENTANQMFSLLEQREKVIRKVASSLPVLKRLADENAEIAIALLEKKYPIYAERVVSFIMDRLAQMENMDSDLLKMHVSINELQIEVASLTAENSALKTRIQQMENSRLWRALEPARKIYAAFFRKRM